MLTATKKHRKGAAVIEMAIVMPVLMLLVWGTIECTGALFTKQTLTSVAHEGALAGMRLNATEADIQNRVQGILSSRAIENCTVNISPSGPAFELLEAGETFTISITNSQENSYIDLTSVSVAVSTVKP